MTNKELAIEQWYERIASERGYLSMNSILGNGEQSLAEFKVITTERTDSGQGPNGDYVRKTTSIEAIGVFETWNQQSVNLFDGCESLLLKTEDESIELDLQEMRDMHRAWINRYFHLDKIADLTNHLAGPEVMVTQESLTEELAYNNA